MSFFATRPPNWSRNSIGFLRLFLASLVIIGHAPGLGNLPQYGWFLTGKFPYGYTAVIGFFFISGILITRSLERGNNYGIFFKRRVLRIFPGFWACLLVGAFIVSPLALKIAPAMGSYHVVDGFKYVGKNFFLYLREPRVSGVFPNGLNSPLWTLVSEFGCYVLTAVLAALTLTKERRIWVALLAIAACIWVVWHHQAQGKYSFLVHVTSYLAGMSMYFYSDRIPASWGFASLAAVLFALGGHVDYLSVLYVPATGWLLYNLAFLLPCDKVGVRQDFSYGIYIYGWPIQALLTLLGVARLGLWPYVGITFLVLVPTAAASWYLVEGPAQRLGKGKKALAATDVSAGSDIVAGPP